jgi:hypothetical protein
MQWHYVKQGIALMVLATEHQSMCVKMMPGIFSLTYFMHIQEQKWKSNTMMEKAGMFDMLY